VRHDFGAMGHGAGWGAGGCGDPTLVSAGSGRGCMVGQVGKFPGGSAEIRWVASPISSEGGEGQKEQSCHCPYG
jgi:hypothetical protein